MASTQARGSIVCWLFATGVVSFLLCGPAAVSATAGDIRPLQDRNRRLLANGSDASSTFKRVIDRIAESDVVVFVDLDPSDQSKLEGGFQFVGAAAGTRYLQGAPEKEAQKREQELRITFIRDEGVDCVVGRRYLEALQKRRNRDRVLSAAPPSAGTREPFQTPSGPARAHHFFCNTGYSQADCDAQSKRLREVLAGMDLARLGEWTWVLVQSQDWKPILRRVGRDPDSPAFTILDKRQTFLEEALFRPDVDRSRILLEKYRAPLDQLLYVAITHELGHAICHEVDELKAIGYANQLRNTGRVLCEQPVPPPQSRATRGAANSASHAKDAAR